MICIYARSSLGADVLYQDAPIIRVGRLRLLPSLFGSISEEGLSACYSDELAQRLRQKILPLRLQPLAVTPRLLFLGAKAGDLLLILDFLNREMRFLHSFPSSDTDYHRTFPPLRVWP
jgi:hypothetical protein